MYIYDVSSVTYQMKPFSVTLLATDTVSRLGHWMPGKIKNEQSDHDQNIVCESESSFTFEMWFSPMKSESDVHLWKVKVIVSDNLSPIKSESDCDCHLWKVKTQSSFTKMLRLRSLLFHACLACSSLNINILIWTMNDSGDGYNHNMMRRRRKKRMMKITLSLWVDHRVAPLAQEAEGSPQEHLCGIFRWELKQEDEQKKDGVDRSEDNLALRVTEVSTFPLPSLLT